MQFSGTIGNLIFTPQVFRALLLFHIKKLIVIAQKYKYKSND